MPLINAAVAQRPDVNLRGKATFGDILAQNAPTLAAAWLQYRQEKKADAKADEEEGRENQQKFLEGDPQVYGAITNEIGVEGLQSIYKFPLQFAQGIYDTVQQNGMGGPTVAATDPALAGTPIDQPTLRPPTQVEQAATDTIQAQAKTAGAQATVAQREVASQQTIDNESFFETDAAGKLKQITNPTRIKQLTRAHNNGTLSPTIVYDPSIAPAARAAGQTIPTFLNQTSRARTAGVAQAENAAVASGQDIVRNKQQLAAGALDLAAKRLNLAGGRVELGRAFTKAGIPPAKMNELFAADDPMAVNIDFSQLLSDGEIVARETVDQELAILGELGITGAPAVKFLGTLRFALPAVQAEAAMAEAIAKPHLIGLRSKIAEADLVTALIRSRGRGAGGLKRDPSEESEELRQYYKSIGAGRAAIAFSRAKTDINGIDIKGVSDAAYDVDFFQRMAIEGGSLEERFAAAANALVPGANVTAADVDLSGVSIKVRDSKGRLSQSRTDINARNYLQTYAAIGDSVNLYTAGLVEYEDQLQQITAAATLGLIDPDNPDETAEEAGKRISAAAFGADDGDGTTTPAGGSASARVLNSTKSEADIEAEWIDSFTKQIETRLGGAPVDEENLFVPTTPVEETP